MKKIVLSIIFALGCAQTTDAITPEVCYGITAGSGIVTGGTIWYLTNKPIFGIGAGGVASLIAYYFAYQYTPEGRYANAFKYVARAENNPLSVQSFESEEAFFDALEDFYVADDWWLVQSFNELTQLLDGCRSAVDLLDKARIETIDHRLSQQCMNLSSAARKCILNLATAVKRIRKHKDYIAQMKEYKRMMIEREKMHIEQQKANAAMSQANATWHMAMK